MSSSLSLPYTCPACGKTFAATVSGLTDPDELVSEGSRDALRKSRAAQVVLSAKLGVRGPSGDPVAELRANILKGLARADLVYATCPGCGARNPEGVRVARKERLASKWGAVAFFAVIAGAAYFVPWIAFVAPALWLLITGISVYTARKAASPRLWIHLPQFVFAVCVVVAMHVWPRWAFGVPGVFALIMTLQKSRAGDASFEASAKRIRFHLAPYREQGI